MDGGAGLVLNIHLAPQTRDLHCTLFHKGTQTQLPMHRNTSCAVGSSRSAKGRTQKVGARDRHIHIRIHIYIYNSDSLYKVGEEKREGGTLLGHHTEDVA